MLIKRGQTTCFSGKTLSAHRALPRALSLQARRSIEICVAHDIFVAQRLKLRHVPPELLKMLQDFGKGLSVAIL